MALNNSDTYITSKQAAEIGGAIRNNNASSIVFTADGISGVEEIPVEERLGDEGDDNWIQLVDKNGTDVKITATVTKIRVVAPGIFRANKPDTTNATAVYVSR